MTPSPWDIPRLIIVIINYGVGNPPPYNPRGFTYATPHHGVAEPRSADWSLPCHGPLSHILLATPDLTGIMVHVPTDILHPLVSGPMVPEPRTVPGDVL
jgi:hypothetical protein